MEQEKKPLLRGWRLFLANILLMIVVSVVLVVIAINWLDSYTHHGEAVTVPDVKGMDISQARDVFSKAELNCMITDSNYIKTEPAGAVLDYNPPAGEKVKKGRIIYLTVNTLNIPLQDVPDVADNSSMRQAEARIRAAGFRLDSVQYVSGEKDWVYGVKYGGRVLMAGDKVPDGAVLQLMVGAGEDFVPDSLRNDSTGVAADVSAGRRNAAKGKGDDDSWF